MTTFQTMSDDPGPPTTVEAPAEAVPVYDIHIFHQLSEETMRKIGIMRREIDADAEKTNRSNTAKVAKA